ncbi:response regulator [Myxococcota bacterium]|nr:response regulator [Myxococcota bacterium]
MTSETPKVSIYKVRSSGSKVLIVDDEPLVARALSRRLGKNHNVDVSNSPIDARELLRNNPDYQVVISDLNMPEMNGLELFEWCQKSCPHHKDHFVFITGTPFSDLAAQVRTSTSAAVLSKPIDIRLLDDEIIRIIGEEAIQH